MRKTARIRRTAARNVGRRVEPLGNVAYKQIREAIRTGTYKPGQRVREADFAEWLRMSRTPVREALHRIESEGLISYEARRGLVIAKLDHQMVMELYALRETLEGTAARLAARHASDLEIAMLEQMVRDEAEMKDDPKLLREHNRVFHEALFRSAHNRFLLRVIGTVRDSIMLLNQTTFSVPGRPQSAVTEHRAIVEAIVLRDADRAESAAREHIRITLRYRLKMLAGQGEEVLA